MGTNKLLSIEKLTVYGDRIVAKVLVDTTRAYTTPSLARRILQEKPSLAHHACINEQGPTFAAVIEHTPMPHLFEHLVVDILSFDTLENPLVNSLPGSECVVGTSEWIDKQKGYARVEVSYSDDLLALAAFKKAEEFLNNLTA